MSQTHLNNVPAGYDLSLRKKVAAMEYEKAIRFRDKKESEEQAEKIRELNDEKLLLLGFIDDVIARMNGIKYPETESMKYGAIMRNFINEIDRIKSLKEHMTEDLPKIISELNNSMK